MHRLAQITAHQSKPIAIGQNLIRTIHRSDGIFAIHDGRNCTFQQDIVYMRFIAAANIALWIDLNGNVQTGFLQNHLNQSSAVVFIYPYVLRRIRKSGNQRIPHNLIACHIRM